MLHIGCYRKWLIILLSIKTWKSDTRVKTWLFREMVEKWSSTLSFSLFFLYPKRVEHLSKALLTTSCVSICPQSSKAFMANFGQLAASFASYSRLNFIGSLGSAWVSYKLFCAHFQWMFTEYLLWFRSELLMCNAISNRRWSYSNVKPLKSMWSSL